MSEENGPREEAIATPVDNGTPAASPAPSVPSPVKPFQRGTAQSPNTSSPAPQPTPLVQSTPPPNTNADSAPLREDMIENAVKFLKHPSVKTSPESRRVAFLQSKGLNQREITVAFQRSGLQPPSSIPATPATTPSTSVVATSTPSGALQVKPQVPPPPPAYAGAGQPQIVYAYPPPPPPSPLGGTVLLGFLLFGLGAGISYFVQNYLVPMFRQNKKAIKDKATTRAIEETKSELKELKELCSTLVRQLQSNTTELQTALITSLRASAASATSTLTASSSLPQIDNQKLETLENQLQDVKGDLASVKLSLDQMLKNRERELRKARAEPTPLSASQQILSPSQQIFSGPSGVAPGGLAKSAPRSPPQTNTPGPTQTPLNSSAANQSSTTTSNTVNPLSLSTSLGATYVPDDGPKGLPDFQKKYTPPSSTPPTTTNTPTTTTTTTTNAEPLIEPEQPESAPPAPYSTSFLEIAQMLKEGKTPPGIRTDIDDTPILQPTDTTYDYKGSRAAPKKPFQTMRS